MVFFVISRQSKTQHVKGEGSRIPTSLQAVFIASNRGAEVVKPPPQKTAFKMFGTPSTWFGKSSCDSNSKSKSRKIKKKESLPVNRRNTMKITEERSSKAVCDTVPTDIAVPRTSKPKKAPIPTLSPQKYLESLLRSRGYSTEYFDVLNSAYYSKPTQLQEASYDVYIVDVVRRNDSDTLGELFASGLHPNACNNFGESLIHLACRRGNFQALQIMLDFQCNIQVADDYGRTPLHDLCWAAEPCFQSAAMILEIDSRLLFMQDIRGSPPLSYARKEHWASWIKFLESRKDEYWPKRRQDLKQGPPELTEHAPNSRQLKDPENALSTRLATLVSSGKMTVEEADAIRDFDVDGKFNNETQSGLNCESNDSDDDSSYPDDADDSEGSASSFFDDEEMGDILETLNAMKATAAN